MDILTIEPEVKKISIRLRLGTMLLDHFLMCIIIVPLIILIKQIYGTGLHPTLVPSYLTTPLFAIYFCKDCIKGRSLGKRMLHLVILDNKTGVTASSFQTLVRNLLIPLWPIEVIVAFFNQERRIGDRLASTKLAVYNKQIPERKAKPLEIVGAIVTAVFFAYLIGEIVDSF